MKQLIKPEWLSLRCISQLATPGAFPYHSPAHEGFFLRNPHLLNSTLFYKEIKTEAQSWSPCNCKDEKLWDLFSELFDIYKELQIQ